MPDILRPYARSRGDNQCRNRAAVEHSNMVKEGKDRGQAEHKGKEPRQREVRKERRGDNIVDALSGTRAYQRKGRTVVGQRLRR